jgi:myosin heavy subunit
MLPFLQQKIAARKLLIYADQSSQNPMNAAEITNDTGKTLDGGPITVFDAGAYGGEALMETLKASDKRLISYATDLGTRITTQFDSGSEVVREIHFRRGVLTTRQAIQETRTYTIRNADQKAKTLIVEHRARPGYKLINLKPAETTATAYRFEIKLAAGAVEKLPVAEERVFDNSFAITNLTPDVLMSYVQNKALSEAARAQLEKIAQQKRLFAETDGAMNRTQQESNELSQDQNRLRQNIESLNRVSGQQEQVQQYARQLASQETQLAGLRDRLAELRKKKAALESELNSLIEKMEF